MQVNITTNLKDQFRDSVPNPRDKKGWLTDSPHFNFTEQQQFACHVASVGGGGCFSLAGVGLGFGYLGLPPFRFCCVGRVRVFRFLEVLTGLK